MIKKPTLIVLICAIVLGGAVYYFDWRKSSEPKPSADVEKPAFTFQAADVVSFTLSHPAQPAQTPVKFEKRGEAWQIVDPVDTDADQSTADGIVDAAAGAETMGTEPGTADRRKAYGLDPAQAELQLHLKNGATHTILIGNASFGGDSVYGVVDNGTTVSLLPQLLSTVTNRSLDDLRNRSLLRVDSSQVASFDLKNPSGQLAAKKSNDEWRFTTPSDSLASHDAVDSLLQGVTNAKMVSVASEKPENLAKYGLTAPTITLTVADSKGARSTLEIGKKDGDNYFARDESRPMIFRVSGDVYKKLDEGFADLRNKNVVHPDSASIQMIQIHDSSGEIDLSQKKDSPGDWIFDAPADQKGKAASGAIVIDALNNLTADEVIDHPAANLLAQVDKPAVSVVLVGNGKTTTVKISKASGDFVYAQSSDSKSLYKLKKSVLDNVDFKPAGLVL